MTDPPGQRQGEKILLVRAVCHATVEELWVLRVPTEVAMRMMNREQDPLELLDSKFVLGVENTDTYNEHDRAVMSVTSAEITDAVNAVHLLNRLP